MPKVSKRKPRVTYSVYNVGHTKVKYCAFCKNHDEYYPEKNHKSKCRRNNAGHFKECKQCLQNHKKSLNVKKWRENKNKNVGNAIGEFLRLSIKKSPVDMIANNCEDILGLLGIQSSPLENDEAVQAVEMEVDDAIDSPITAYIVPPTTEQPDSTKNDLGLILAVMPHNYPDNSFSNEDTDALQTYIEDMIDNMNEGKRFPKFSSSINESGYWRVSCVDDFTREWFLNVISNFEVYVNGSNEPIKAVSINDVKKFVITTEIPVGTNESSDPNKVLNKLQKQNPWLDISRWNEITPKDCNERHKIKFEIHLMSLRQIMDNNYQLDYGTEKLKLEII